MRDGELVVAVLVVGKRERSFFYKQALKRVSERSVQTLKTIEYMSTKLIKNNSLT
mgnify:CR=1 FL=1